MQSYFTLNHILEIPAVIFGVLNIYLAARANIWNFLFGFFTCTLYFILDLRVKIYADMTLQIIFVAFQFYGFYQWRYGGEGNGGRVIAFAPRNMLYVAVIALFIIAGVYAYILATFTDSTLLPLDISATALSIVAQWLMSKKWVENWWLWMVIDIVSVAMYALKHLYLSAGLYTILLGLAIMGAVTWQQRAKNNFFAH
jgi:nicotinamide mononucleotide transporter